MSSGVANDSGPIVPYGGDGEGNGKPTDPRETSILARLEEGQLTKCLSDLSHSTPPLLRASITPFVELDHIQRRVAQVAKEIIEGSGSSKKDEVEAVIDAIGKVKQEKIQALSKNCFGEAWREADSSKAFIEVCLDRFELGEHCTEFEQLFLFLEQALPSKLQDYIREQVQQGGMDKIENHLFPLCTQMLSLQEHMPLEEAAQIYLSAQTPESPLQACLGTPKMLLSSDEPLRREVIEALMETHTIQEPEKALVDALVRHAPSNVSLGEMHVALKACSTWAEAIALSQGTVADGAGTRPVDASFEKEIRKLTPIGATHLGGVQTFALLEAVGKMSEGELLYEGRTYHDKEWVAPEDRMTPADLVALKVLAGLNPSQELPPRHQASEEKSKALPNEFGLEVSECLHHFMDEHARSAVAVPLEALHTLTEELSRAMDKQEKEEREVIRERLAHMQQSLGDESLRTKEEKALVDTPEGQRAHKALQASLSKAIAANEQEGKEVLEPQRAAEKALTQALKSLKVSFDNLCISGLPSQLKQAKAKLNQVEEARRALLACVEERLARPEMQAAFPEDSMEEDSMEKIIREELEAVKTYLEGPLAKDLQVIREQFTGVLSVENPGNPQNREEIKTQLLGFREFVREIPESKHRQDFLAETGGSGSLLRACLQEADKCLKAHPAYVKPEVSPHAKPEVSSHALVQLYHSCMEWWSGEEEKTPTPKDEPVLEIGALLGHNPTSMMRYHAEYRLHEIMDKSGVIHKESAIVVLDKLEAVVQEMYDFASAKPEVCGVCEELLGEIRQKREEVQVCGEKFMDHGHVLALAAQVQNIYTTGLLEGIPVQTPEDSSASLRASSAADTSSHASTPRARAVADYKEASKSPESPPPRVRSVSPQRASSATRTLSPSDSGADTGSGSEGVGRGRGEQVKEISSSVPQTPGKVAEKPTGHFYDRVQFEHLFQGIPEAAASRKARKVLSDYKRNGIPEIRAVAYPLEGGMTEEEWLDSLDPMNPTHLIQAGDRLFLPKNQRGAEPPSLETVLRPQTLKGPNPPMIPQREKGPRLPHRLGGVSEEEKENAL